MTNYTTPTHDLTQMIVLIRQGQYKTTKGAREGATKLGLSLADMIAIVVDLPNTGRFYKTMESEKNPGHWMDVYHTKTRASDDVYLKLMIQDGVLLVSFKEL